jgi:hypothetical protein
MNKATIKEVTAKSALTKLKRKIPYGWDMNIKTNIVDVLEQELKSEKWKVR